MFTSAIRTGAAASATLMVGLTTLSATVPVAAQADSTSDKLDAIHSSVKSIEADLGIGASKARVTDPAGNFPAIRPDHKSLTAKILRERPDLYTKVLPAHLSPQPRLFTSCYLQHTDSALSTRTPGLTTASHHHTTSTAPPCFTT